MIWSCVAEYRKNELSKFPFGNSEVAQKKRASRLSFLFHRKCVLWNQVCIVKGFDTGKLIIRHTEAYRRDADGTEFIKRRAACGKCEIAGRHECSHIGNLFMQDNAAVFSCHDGKLCAVDMHGTCQDVEGNILPVVRCAETF